MEFQGRSFGKGKQAEPDRVSGIVLDEFRVVFGVS
jgi:hypothetical protein